MTRTDCSHFNTQADVDLPAMARAGNCACLGHARRRLGGALIGSGALALLGAPAARAEDAECKRSAFTRAVSAEQIEQSASQQYRQMLQEASGQRALAPVSDAQVQRLQYIAKRIIPLTEGCNSRARQWRWDVNLIGSQQVNAFCMPGGKIAFYSGILSKLQLDDDEVAMIMGHEVSHALLEHARERMGKTMATRGAVELGAALFGLGGVGRTVADMGSQLLTLRFSRDDESEADALGLLLAARAGYRPQAGVTLWQKMLAANKGAPPQWMSTHPAGETRIHDMQNRLARVEPEYERADKPDRRFAPPRAA